MPGHDIIAIGASTGAVEALSSLVAGLPPDLPAAVFVVVHILAQTTSHLPQILDRAGPLPAAHAVDGEPIRQGRIYCAPPDLHLMVEREHVRLVRGPKENRCRPAIDPLFRTAARAYGTRVVGVVLTGALDDGASGLQAIKRRGGIAVVQDPEDALIPDMPRSALKYVAVDQCLPLASIPSMLARLAREPARDEGAFAMPEDMELDIESAEFNLAKMEANEMPGTLSSFTCPECRGPLWELRDGELVRFRCRSGHAFTADSMLAQQSETLEQALWIALNTLNESALMAERLAKEARERNHRRVAERFDEKVRRNQQGAAMIQQVLESGEAAAAKDTALARREEDAAEASAAGVGA
jgi:two-component system chemotaxis response regulator CheB